MNAVRLVSLNEAPVTECEGLPARAGAAVDVVAGGPADGIPGEADVGKAGRGGQAGRCLGPRVNVESELTQPELPLVLPIRLSPAEAKVPLTSGTLLDGGVPRHDGVAEGHRACDDGQAATIARGGVAADGAVGQRGRAREVDVHGPAGGWRCCR